MVCNKAVNIPLTVTELTLFSLIHCSPALLLLRLNVIHTRQQTLLYFTGLCCVFFFFFLNKQNVGPNDFSAGNIVKSHVGQEHLKSRAGVKTLQDFNNAAKGEILKALPPHYSSINTHTHTLPHGLAFLIWPYPQSEFEYTLYINTAWSYKSTSSKWVINYVYTLILRPISAELWPVAQTEVRTIASNPYSYNMMDVGAVTVVKEL